MLHAAARLNGMTELTLNKLDILSGLETVKLAVAYLIDGKRTTAMPYDLMTLAKAEPVYEELPGWSGDITGLRKFADLPSNAQTYLKRIESLVGVPVASVGVGPARDQVILP